MSDTTAQSPKDWPNFDRRIRRAGRSLLCALGNYHRPILVGGCQRSGTTVVATLLKLATSVSYLNLTGDSELDDALVLCGEQTWDTDERVCFQTTYLNEQFDEYWQHDHYTLVWVLREPVAVVRSMLTNWSADALARLYRGVGQRHRKDLSAPLGLRKYLPGATALEQACASYLGKIEQLGVLLDTLPSERLLLIDYADLLARKSDAVQLLCDKLSIEYTSTLDGVIGQRSKRKRPHVSLQNIDGVADDNCSGAYRQYASRALQVAAA